MNLHSTLFEDNKQRIKFQLQCLKSKKLKRNSNFLIPQSISSVRNSGKKEERTIVGIGPREKTEGIVAGDVTGGGGFGSEMEKTRCGRRRERERVVEEEGLGRRTGRSERESECGEAYCSSRGFRHWNGTELTTKRYVTLSKPLSIIHSTTHRAFVRTPSSLFVAHFWIIYLFIYLLLLRV